MLVLVRNTVHRISWEDCISDTIDITYCLTGTNGIWNTVALGTDAHNDGDFAGYYDWNIPSNLPDSSNLYIRVSDTSVPIIYDEKGPYTVVTTSVPLTLANGQFVNVDEYINDGYNVSFKDIDNNTINAGKIFLNTAGTVSFAGVGYTTGISMRLLAGRVHKIGGIGTIFSGDTTPNLGICVKL